MQNYIEVTFVINLQKFNVKCEITDECTFPMAWDAIKDQVQRKMFPEIIQKLSK